MAEHSFGASVEVDVREVELKAGGARLRALLAVPASPCGWVVFAHEGGNSLHGSAHGGVARALNQAGLATLSMELLTAAEAVNRRKAFETTLLAERLMAGAEWLGVESGSGVGCFGAGEGAAAALWAAAEKGSGIESLVACAPRLDLASERLGEVRASTLLIVGGADRRALKQVRWARKRLGSSELIVVPGATRLFDAPAALRALADHSVEWFKRTVSGEAEAIEQARAGLSRESRRRLAAAASLLMLGGFILGPKVANATTAFFDSATGHLGVAIPNDGDQATVTVDGSLNVVVVDQLAATVPITAPGDTTPLTVSSSSVLSLWVDGDGYNGANPGGPTVGGPAGVQLMDLRGVTGANGFVAANFAPSGSLTAQESWMIGGQLGNGNDTGYGSAFGDFIADGGNDDWVDYGDGDDFNNGNAGNDYFLMGNGNDTVQGGNNNDTIFGGPGNDFLQGGANADVLMGDDGDDTLQNGDGGGTIDGGAGIDRFSKTNETGAALNTPSSLVLTGNSTSAQLVQTGAASQTIPVSNCEIPQLTGGGNYLSYPTYNSDDTIDLTGWTETLGSALNGGDGGNDLIIGTAGPDTITVSFGVDTVQAGAGTDILIFDIVVDASSVTGTQANTIPAAVAATMLGGAGDTLTFVHNDTTPVSLGWDLSQFENISIQTADGADTVDVSAVTVPTAAPSITSNAGADLITGSPLNDMVNGNAENDTITTGAGNDTVNAGDGDDSIATGDGNDSVAAGNGNDSIAAGAGNDTVNGEANDDNLNGGAGDDRYIFGSTWGVDALADASGNDTVDFSTYDNDTVGGLGISFGGSLTARAGAYSLSTSDDIEDVFGGAQNDIVSVIPGSATLFADGGGGDANHLKYDGAPLSGVTVTASGSDTVPSTISGAGVQDVLYVNFAEVDTVLVSSARIWQVFE